MARNRDRARDLLPVEFGPSAQVLFVVLFVLTGAAVTLGELAAGAGMALAYVLVRLAGKLLGVVMFSAPSGLSTRKAGLLGLTLTPMSATAVAMVDATARYYPQFGDRVASIVLGAVLILELTAPLATQLALRAAGEARADAGWR